MELSGKKIILSVTGGIAAYKSVTLLRLLTKEGAEVQVLMTPTARQFVTPVTFSALSGKTVLSDFFDAGGGDWNSHIDLGISADLLIIAPATATTMGKLANGIADNLVVATYLSARCPVVVVPAMDMDMYAHPSTQRNLDILASYGNHIVQPAEGELASGLSGKGRMQEPEVILQYIQSLQADEKKKS
jgi:phosphopantothenoylcysteine decarboxylase / phosphopantothenate---cysteine ligase